MTIDTTELKKAAEACDVNKCADEAEWDRRFGEFLSECDPDVTLAMLADIEALHAQHGRDSGELRKLCSARDSARRQRDQLKTENEALRKDAERYRWLRQMSLPLDGHDFLSTQEVLDRRVDSAMDKEKL